MIRGLMKAPPHRSVRVPKHGVIHPTMCGAVRTIGEALGANHYEFTLEDEGRIHIIEYHDRNYYEVHRDLKSPLKDPINHLRLDAPSWWIVLTGVSGGIVGLIVGRILKHPALGTVLGIIAGLGLGFVTSNW